MRPGCGQLHQLDDEVVGAPGVDHPRAGPCALANELHRVDRNEAESAPGRDHHVDVVDFEAQVQVTVVAGSQARARLVRWARVAQQLDRVARRGHIADVDDTAWHAGDLLEHLAAARYRRGDGKPERVPKVADGVVEVRDGDAGVTSAQDTAGRALLGGGISGHRPVTSTTHTPAPTATSSPSATQCSSITPSAVAVTSWLTFTVSIS